MSWVSAGAIYFVVWWLVLFTVLPWRATSHHELGHDIAPGHAASAPVNPHLAAKFLATTLISAALFAAGWGLSQTGWLTLDNIPFLPDFRPARAS
jgi:predicted secreted protein